LNKPFNFWTMSMALCLCLIVTYKGFLHEKFTTLQLYVSMASS
jgi:hypothetical protein